MGAEADSPLLILARRMLALALPPSLSVLLSRMEDSQSYEEFAALVREYLPEREGDILGQSSPEAQVAAFADHFGDRYFPLQDYLRDGDRYETGAQAYADITSGLPVMVMGFGYDDYHELPDGSRPGVMLLTYLIEDPWDRSGGRVAIGEACVAHVPIELLQRVPPEGLIPADAHRLLDATPYHAVALWGDILHQDTGNGFLDTSMQELWEMPFPQWSREEVEGGARYWAQAEETHQQINSFMDWLEEDPQARFKEILDFIDERRGTGGSQIFPLPVGPP